jgi:hypothetical protein
VRTGGAAAGLRGRRRLGLVLEGVDAGGGFDADGNQFVEGGDDVARAEFAGILAVVVEILLGEQAVFVADEPVGVEMGGIEFDLELDVLGDGEEGAGGLFDEALAGLGEGVDVGIVAVALVGEGFEAVVLVVAHAVAEDGEEDALLGAVGEEGRELLGVDDADIEVAVGAEDDAVVAVGEEGLAGFVVGEADAGAAGGAAAGLEVVEGGIDGGEVAGGVGGRTTPVALA